MSKLLPPKFYMCIDESVPDKVYVEQIRAAGYDQAIDESEAHLARVLPELISNTFIFDSIVNAQIINLDFTTEDLNKLAMRLRADLLEALGVKP